MSVNFYSNANYLVQALEQKSSDYNFSNLQLSVDVQPTRMLGEYTKDVGGGKNIRYYYGKSVHPNTAKLERGGAMMILEDNFSKSGIDPNSTDLVDFLNDINNLNFQNQSHIDSFLADKRVQALLDGGFAPYEEARMAREVVNFSKSVKQRENEQGVPKDEQTSTSEVYAFIQGKPDPDGNRFKYIKQHLNAYMKENQNQYGNGNTNPNTLTEQDANLLRKTIHESALLSQELSQSLQNGEFPMYMIQPPINQMVLADGSHLNDDPDILKHPDPLTALGGVAIVGDLTSAKKITGHELHSGVFMSKTTPTVIDGDNGLDMVLKQDLHRVVDVFGVQAKTIEKDGKNTSPSMGKIYKRFGASLAQMSTMYFSKKFNNRLFDSLTVSINRGSGVDGSDFPVPDMVFDFSKNEGNIAKTIKQDMRPLDNPEYLNLALQRAKIESNIAKSLNERMSDGNFCPIKLYDEAVARGETLESLKTTQPELIKNLEADLSTINPAYVTKLHQDGFKNKGILGVMPPDDKMTYAIYLEKKQADDLETQAKANKTPYEHKQPLFAQYMQTALISKQMLEMEMKAEFLRHAFNADLETYKALGITSKDVLNKSELADFNSNAQKNGTLKTIFERAKGQDGELNPTLKDFADQVLLDSLSDPDMPQYFRAGIGGKNSAFKALVANDGLRQYETQDNRRELYRNGASLYHILLHNNHKEKEPLQVSLVQGRKFMVNHDNKSDILLSKNINKELESMLNGDFMRNHTAYRPDGIELKTRIGFGGGDTKAQNENAKIAVNGLAMGSNLMRFMHVATNNNNVVNSNGIFSSTAIDHISHLKTANRLMAFTNAIKPLFLSKEAKQKVGSYVERLSANKDNAIIPHLLNHVNDLVNSAKQRFNPNSINVLGSPTTPDGKTKPRAQITKENERMAELGISATYNIQETGRANLSPTANIIQPTKKSASYAGVETPNGMSDNAVLTPAQALNENSKTSVWRRAQWEKERQEKAQKNNPQTQQPTVNNQSDTPNNNPQTQVQVNVTMNDTINEAIFDDKATVTNYSNQLQALVNPNPVSEPEPQEPQAPEPPTQTKPKPSAPKPF